MATTREPKPANQSAAVRSRPPSSGGGRSGGREDLRQSVRSLGYEDGARTLSPQGAGSGAPRPSGATQTAEPMAPQADSAVPQQDEAKGLSPEAYQEALGRLLGGRLFDLVSKETSPDQMNSHAKKVVDALVKSAGGLADKDAGQDEAARAAVKKALEETLGPALKAEAEAYLNTEQGRSLEAKLQGYVTGHPWQVVAAAVLAAAGAVAANVQIPRLRSGRTFDLGKGEGAAKLTVGAGVRLGRIRDIALEAIDARIALEAGRFKAEAKAERDKEGDVKGTVSAGVGDERRQVSTTAVLDKDGLLSAKVGGTIKTDHGEASLSAGTERGKGGTADAVVKWAGDQRTLTGAAHVESGGGWNLRLSEEIQKGLWSQSDTIGASDKGVESAKKVRYGDDRNFLAAGIKNQGGTETFEASGRRTMGDLSVGGKVAGGADGLAGEADAKYSARDLTATLNARFGRDTAVVGGSVDRQLTRTLSAGADVQYGIIDRKFLDVGVRFGYRDPEKFEAFLLEYRRSHAGDVPIEQFKATVETTLGQYMVRAQSDNTLKDGRFSAGVGSLQVAKPLDKDWALIGGVSAGYGPERTQGVRPEIGVQYKNIPVTVGYDINNKAFGVRLTIPFGR